MSIGAAWMWRGDQNGSRSDIFMGGHSTILNTPLQPWARSKSGTTIYMIHTLRSNSIVMHFLWEQQGPFQSFSGQPESSLPSMRRLSKGCCNRLCTPLRNWKQRRIKERRANTTIDKATEACYAHHVPLISEPGRRAVLRGKAAVSMTFACETPVYLTGVYSATKQLNQLFAQGHTMPFFRGFSELRN